MGEIERKMAVSLWAALLLAVGVSSAAGFYLPGVAPQDFLKVISPFSRVCSYRL